MSIAAIPPEIWDHELAAIDPAPLAWVWHAFVAVANITLLTSQFKLRWFDRLAAHAARL